MKSRKKYTEQEMRSILDELKTTTLKEILKKYKLYSSQIYKWRKKLNYNNPSTKTVKKVNNLDIHPYQNTLDIGKYAHENNIFSTLIDNITNQVYERVTAKLSAGFIDIFSKA